jgi:predicted TIM-barrel fold metal-dependent hydrolase
MKFMSFNLMPYRFLPMDFPQQHRSVWVDIPGDLYDPVKGNQLYNEYMDQLEYAAQIGFDGICVNEHHANGYGLMPSPNIIAAGLARRTKDVALLHEGPEAFLTMMVLDGVLERHPGLRGASVELGAGWVPELLRRLDWVVKHWSRNDANLQGLSRTPSEQITAQLAFTPFVFEEVGLFIDQSNPDLYLFSSDYPHIEGGRNPIARFEAALGNRSDAIREQFYAENFLRIFPDARVPQPLKSRQTA